MTCDCDSVAHAKIAALKLITSGVTPHTRISSYCPVLQHPNMGKERMLDVMTASVDVMTAILSKIIPAHNLIKEN